jgi:hypothetical protein
MPLSWLPFPVIAATACLSLFVHVIVMFCVLTVLGRNAMPNSVVSTRLLMHTHGSLQAAGSDDSEDDAMSEASSSADVGDAQLHLRNVAAPSAINRVCCMHQQPGIVATWGENGAVSILNVSKLLTDLAAEEKPREKGGNSLLQVTSTCCHVMSCISCRLPCVCCW